MRGPKTPRWSPACLSRSLSLEWGLISWSSSVAKAPAVIYELLQVWTCPHELKTQIPSRRNLLVSAFAKRGRVRILKNPEPRRSSSLERTFMPKWLYLLALAYHQKIPAISYRSQSFGPGEREGSMRKDQSHAETWREVVACRGMR